MSNPPISSEEFQQKIQAGQINEALALVLNQANQLSVTTQITDDIQVGVGEELSSDNADTVAQSAKSEYLATTINLLTGEIQNEVGRGLIVNSSSYIKLQQLHIDRIISSYRILQGFLHQIKGILTAIESAPISPCPQSESIKEPQQTTESIADRLDLSESLPTRLTAAFRAILTSNSVNSTNHPNLQIDSVAVPPGDRQHQELLAQPLPSRIDPQSTTSQQPPTQNLTDHQVPTRTSAQPVMSPVAFDDEIDLSIDENAVEWEEWVDEEVEVSIPAIESLPPVPPPVSLPDWGEEWDRPQLEPITVKPAVPRTPTISGQIVDPAAQWDKFVPEHVGIYVDPKTPTHNHNDPHQIDRLLADLDRISQGNRDSSHP